MTSVRQAINVSQLWIQL